MVRRGRGAAEPDCGAAAGGSSGPRPSVRSPRGAATDVPADPVSAAKSICLQLLTAQVRSRAELAAKLGDRGIPEAAATVALDRLTEVGLIDDEAYADRFVASRHRERGLGRRAIRMELERRGIDRAIVDRAVQAIGDDDERERATELVAKKLDAAVYGGLAGARRRLLGMLARRGYPASVAVGVVNDALLGYVDPLDVPDD